MVPCVWPRIAKGNESSKFLVRKDVMHVLTRIVKVLSKILPKPAICAFSRTSELFGSKMNRTIENAHEGEERMRLVGAEGAGVKAESNLQYLPAPTKSQNDKKNYK